MKKLTILIAMLMAIGGCAQPTPSFDPAKPPSQQVNPEFYDLALLCSSDGLNGSDFGPLYYKDKYALPNNADHALFLYKKRKKIIAYEQDGDFRGVSPKSNLLSGTLESYSWSHTAENYNYYISNGVWKERSKSNATPHYYSLFRDTLVLIERYDGGRPSPYIKNSHLLHQNSYHFYSKCSVKEVSTVLSKADIWHADWVNKEILKDKKRIRERQEKKAEQLKDNKI